MQIVNATPDKRCSIVHAIQLAHMPRLSRDQWLNRVMGRCTALWGEKISNEAFLSYHCALFNEIFLTNPCNDSHLELSYLIQTFIWALPDFSARRNDIWKKTRLIFMCFIRSNRNYSIKVGRYHEQITSKLICSKKCFFIYKFTPLCRMADHGQARSLNSAENAKMNANRTFIKLLNLNKSNLRSH